MLPSFIVKALISCCFSNKEEKILCKRNIAAIFSAGIITVGLYYLTDVVVMAISSATNLSEIIEKLRISSFWLTGLYYAPANLIQAVVSGIIFVLIALALDKSEIKNKLR